MFETNKTSKMKLYETQSKEGLSRSFNKSSFLSKFRYFGVNDTNNELSIDHTEIMIALGHIN